MRMVTRGEYTREEIFSQPESWTEAIHVLEGRMHEIQDFALREQHSQFIFIGCGSTYYLSCAAAASFQEITGLPARGLPASELWLSPQSVYSSSCPTILIAISRSGETSETIQACELFTSQNNGRLVTLVCNRDSSLAKMGTLNLAFPSGMERSIAQTRAFSTLYMGALGISSVWARQLERFDQMRALPVVGRKILNEYCSFAEKHGRDLALDRIYFLGSGGRYGLACELNLKMKEMSLTHSEAFHFLEFRHGPKAMVTPSTLIVGLVSTTNAGYELAVLDDIGELGAEIITVGESKADVSFNSDLEEVSRNILYLPFGQMLAYERSIAKGFDPDRPMHLDPVVKLSR
jgi:glucosamine--fructose-6-phosphate aminotransferase (isomerizing)